MSLGFAVVAFIVYVLAVARLTKLINSDLVTDPFRLWIAKRAEVALNAAVEAESAMQPLLAARLTRRNERWNTAAYFVECPWCPSLWITLGTAWVPLWFAHNPVAQYVGVALASAHLVGIGAALLAALNTEDHVEIVKT